MGTSACSGGQGQAWRGEPGSHTAQGDRKGPQGLAGHSLGGSVLGQGCRQLETVSVVALLGQGLIAPWGCRGVLGPGEMLGRKSYCCPQSLDSHITPGQLDFPYIWLLMCYKGWKLLTTDIDFCLTCEHTCAGRAGYWVSLSHNHPFLVFQAHMEII